MHRSQMEATTSCEQYPIYSISQGVTAYKVGETHTQSLSFSLHLFAPLFILTRALFPRFLRQSNTKARSTVSQGITADGCTLSIRPLLLIIRYHHRISRRCGAMNSIWGLRFVVPREMTGRSPNGIFFQISSISAWGSLCVFVTRPSALMSSNFGSLTNVQIMAVQPLSAQHLKS